MSLKWHYKEAEKDLNLSKKHFLSRIFRLNKLEKSLAKTVFSYSCSVYSFWGNQLVLFICLLSFYGSLTNKAFNIICYYDIDPHKDIMLLFIYMEMVLEYLHIFRYIHLQAFITMDEEMASQDHDHNFSNVTTNEVCFIRFMNFKIQPQCVGQNILKVKLHPHLKPISF